MKTSNKKIQLPILKSIALLGCILCLLQACSEDETSGPAPVITSFTPISGKFGTAVTITGENFSTTPSKNKVTFNDVEAVVTGATATTLTVTVPTRAGDGVVEVTTNGKEAIGSNFDFIETYTVSTFAGSGTEEGFLDGAANVARFASPEGMVMDANNNLYVADWSNNKIRKITPAGVVSTYAGASTGSYPQDGPALTATFNGPQGLAIDAQNNLYVTDLNGNRIRKISAAGVVSTIAGNGTQGFADGTGTAASFYFPNGITIDANGNLYVADEGNHRIRKITPTGEVSTLAGSGVAGFANGTGTWAQFKSPKAAVCDAVGNIYVTDNNWRMRKITSIGEVTTVAGTGVAYVDDGPAASATFVYVYGLAFDKSGNLFIADFTGNSVRKLSSEGYVSTLLGGSFVSYAADYVDGYAATAKFNGPTGIVVQANGDMYVSDSGNNRIRKITYE